VTALNAERKEIKLTIRKAKPPARTDRTCWHTTELPQIELVYFLG